MGKSPKSEAPSVNLILWEVSADLTLGPHDNLCCCFTSVVADSVQPHRRQPTRLLHPWDSPGKNTGVGCHFLLQWQSLSYGNCIRFIWLSTSEITKTVAVPTIFFVFSLHENCVNAGIKVITRWDLDHHQHLTNFRRLWVRKYDRGKE